MNINSIVQRVNQYLAGENLTYSELQLHLDSVVDDINHTLNSVFPAFSEFNSNDYADYPNYNFFPDNYIRSVVCLGTAFKFFLTDEEGAEVAQRYDADYQKALFMMLRDYSHSVPAQYQAENQGFLEHTETLYSTGDADTDNLHPQYYLNGEVF